MRGHQAGDFSPTERSLPPPPPPLWQALGNFEIALEPDPLCWLPRRTGEGGAMWKEPLPDFNLSSATLGLRSPFLCQVGSAPNTAHTLCSLNNLRSVAQRQPAWRCREGHGAGTSYCQDPQSPPSFTEFSSCCHDSMWQSLFPSAVRTSAPRKHRLCLPSALQRLTEGWHVGDASERSLNKQIFLFPVFICFALHTRL